MATDIHQKKLGRRQVLGALGTALLAAPFLGLISCSSDDDNTPAVDNGSGDSTGGDQGSVDTIWASGGTASMTANFPDDSLFDLASSCTLALTGALTQGPCYFTADVLDDISEGQGGLPMQLCLRVVDSTCNPVSGLEVEVWHCDVAGLYSADSSDAADEGRDFNSGFCSGNDSSALQSRWFRGSQVTDSQGRVNFKSCFPGWYSGRTIHIHFKVRSNSSESLTSQFCFPESLTSDVCANHPEYSGRGLQDTSLARDNVYGGQYQDYLFDWQQNEDGSLLAFKQIQVA
ncbi:intradiol ring-cleavage dioxygenase [Gallaecimonas xiamenensis]|uniref:Protocatechuate 3,4-dioxygenase beta chain n=1 Tax=Gallaecimonas xiamenensis 3-C-1 TaxID=745411 RepID=K2JGJ4_9GAMM|nr:intradiol ring-cleavage dioxygenase [Gallaecimonas xiamenensis]EKE73662.1 protocatechuate 3,4-dioxygenase beta chain [Gallaecimonas xiamenensis 3-C-1]